MVETVTSRTNITRRSLLKSLIKLGFLVFRVAIIYVEVCLEFLKPQKKKSIRGQNVLITGAGHGLGREMAFRFASIGCNLVLVDIDPDNNEKTKREALNINKSIRVLTYVVDIRNEENVAELKLKTTANLGDIDILVNNAGIVQCRPFLELSSALVERTFQVNVFSHVWTIKHFLPAMKKNGRGHIVAISSIAGLIGGKYLTDYCASKFAVVGLMDALDKEIHDNYQNEKIQLTTVCPASMSTGMFKSFTSRFEWLLPVLTAENVADEVVDAVLMNKSFIAIPARTLLFHRLSSIIPARVAATVQDYLDYGVKPHAA